MIRFERIVTSKTIPPALWTPGLILGVLFYVLSILVLYWLGLETGKNHAPCLLLQTTGIRCPLCGGTSACLSLLTGKPLVALQHNPMVVLTVAFSGILLLLRAFWKIRVSLTSSKPLLVCGIVVLVAINWAYVIRQDSKNNQHPHPVGREFIHRLLQR